jgi:CheY-like chemotaxis protein
MESTNVSPVSKLEEAPRCILVVDDEVLIRFAIADYLRECGYHVIEAADAAEALELLESQPGLVDLVFSDVQMPGEMDGFGLARWVRSNRPGLPVILTSGNARTAELGEDLCEIGPLEAKPYDAKSLAQRMASLLAAAKGLS